MIYNIFLTAFIFLFSFYSTKASFSDSENSQKPQVAIAAKPSFDSNVELVYNSLNSNHFDLPKTEIEQTSIASILSKTDQAIASTEALIAKYSKIKTGLMQDLLTKGIDENGNIRTEETHEFKDSPLGRIPKQWECYLFKEIIQNFEQEKNQNIITKY